MSNPFKHFKHRVTPLKVTPLKVTPLQVTPLKVTPLKVTPREMSRVSRIQRASTGKATRRGSA